MQIGFRKQRVCLGVAKLEQEILDRLKELGGNILTREDKPLAEILLSIEFNTVLYENKIETVDEEEPIYGISEFIDEHLPLFYSDKEMFYSKIVDHYFCLTEAGYGQDFWQGELFTPYKVGSEDYEEWHEIFANEGVDEYAVDLSVIRNIVKEQKPDFIHLFYSYGYPDNYYICLSDPNSDDPIVFGTDHEQFFNDIRNYGKLSEFLKRYMTKDDLVGIIETMLNENK